MNIITTPINHNIYTVKPQRFKTTSSVAFKSKVKIVKIKPQKIIPGILGGISSIAGFWNYKSQKKDFKDMTPEQQKYILKKVACLESSQREAKDLPYIYDAYRLIKDDINYQNANFKLSDWLSRINSYNFSLFKELNSDKNFEKESILLALNFGNNQDSIEAKQKIYDKIKTNKNYAEEISVMLDAVNAVNYPVADKILDEENSCKYKNRAIILSTNRENTEDRLKLYDLCKKYQPESVANILYCSDYINSKFLIKLIEEDFPILSIEIIAGNGTLKKQDIAAMSEIYDILKERNKDSEFTRDLALIVENTRKTNKNLAKKLLTRGSIPNLPISNILRKTYSDKDEEKKIQVYDTLKDLNLLEKDLGYTAANLIESANILNSNMIIQMLKDGLDSADTLEIADSINSENQHIAKALIIDKLRQMDPLCTKSILESINSENIHFVEKMCLDKNLQIPNHDLSSLLYAFSNCETIYDYDYINSLTTDDFNNLYKIYDKERNSMLKNPQLYVEDDDASIEEMIEEIEEFLKYNNFNMLITADIFGKEFLNFILRKRIDEASVDLDAFSATALRYISTLKKLRDCVNTDNKPLLPAVMDNIYAIIAEYVDLDIPLKKITNMIDSGKIDITDLNKEIYYKLLEKVEISEEEIKNIPKENLYLWDLKNIHLLMYEILTAEKENNSNKIMYKDFLKIVFSNPDFKQFITTPIDKKNEEPESIRILKGVNHLTKMHFKKLGLKYENWINPPAQNEVKFLSIDKNNERIRQIANQLTEDMNTLMQTPAATFVEKQFPKFVQNNKFFIPDEILKSKADLTALVKLLSDTTSDGQLAQIWNRAKTNLDKPELADNAQKTMTVLSHLKQRQDDLSKVKNSKITKKLDFTIKMWDRIPQKDIFQGNYSNCCIGMNKGNASAMVCYLSSTAFNMIEIVDNTTGKIVGNALCYFAQDSTEKTPIFVIDNIEINNANKPSDEVGIQLRNAIKEFAENTVKSINKNPFVKTKIILGTSNNDIPTDDLEEKKKTVRLIGNFCTDKIYLDLFDGWNYQDRVTHYLKVPFYEL